MVASRSKGHAGLRDGVDTVKSVIDNVEAVCRNEMFSAASHSQQTMPWLEEYGVQVLRVFVRRYEGVDASIKALAPFRSIQLLSR